MWSSELGHDASLSVSITDEGVQTETIRASHRERQWDVSSTDILRKLNDSIEKNNGVIQRTINTMEKMMKTFNVKNKTDEPTVLDMKRSDKVMVEIKATFLKINNIDTVSQQFAAEVFVQAKWEEPILLDLLHKHRNENEEDINNLIPWVPKLIIMNTDGELAVSRRTYDIHFREPGCSHPVVVMLWRFKGVFKENLELEHFPFDVQDLTVSISSERADSEVELIENQTSLSSINVRAFMDAQEWDVYHHIETYRDFTTLEDCSSTVHPILHVQCRIARKIGYFIWNVVFIVLLIISLTFAACTIPYTVANRLVVTVTLFLTAVAFKLVVQQSLPTISYLTYLDFYVIAALIFLGFMSTQNATMMAASKFLSVGEVNFYDAWSVVGLVGILTLFHVAFGLYIYNTASKKRRIMKEKDRFYETKKQFLEKYGSLPARFDAPFETESDDYFVPVVAKTIHKKQRQ